MSEGDDIDKGWLEAKERFKLVFPDGPPSRPMLIGKHAVGHYTVWQQAIAKAERLDPWLADVLVWHLWWEDLNAERAQWFVDQMNEYRTELDAEREAREKAEERLKQLETVLCEQGNISTSFLLTWMADRLVLVHNEPANVDFVITARARARNIAETIKELSK